MQTLIYAFILKIPLQAPYVGIYRESRGTLIVLIPVLISDRSFLISFSNNNASLIVWAFLQDVMGGSEKTPSMGSFREYPK